MPIKAVYNARITQGMSGWQQTFMLHIHPRAGVSAWIVAAKAAPGSLHGAHLTASALELQALQSCDLAARKSAARAEVRHELLQIVSNE